MADSQEQGTDKTRSSERLLHALAEQLKVPLVQIARYSELSQMTGETHSHLRQIESAAQHALGFIDNYLLSNQLMHRQMALELEPVSLASVLYDSAHVLQDYARQYECDVQLQLNGRYEPVMANQKALQAAMTSMGYVMVDAQSQQRGAEKPTLILAARRCRGGIASGVFADVDGLSMGALKRGMVLHKTARQPLAELSNGSGAGIFIAESLLASMSSHLRAARHHNLNGLAATFLPSQQLTLV